MKPHKIIVYNYYNHNEPGVKYEVNAYCVGGKDGVRAYFLMGKYMYEAHGDNGHWWIVGKIDKSWIEKIMNTISALHDSME